MTTARSSNSNGYSTIPLEAREKSEITEFQMHLSGQQPRRIVEYSDVLPARTGRFFSPLPLRSRLFQLPLKRIFRKPANFLPELNQLVVRHLTQFIPQLPQNFFV
jgi:hypothetical protein